MHDRNVLSLVKDFAGFALVSLASLVAAPVHAEDSNRPLFLAMLAPSSSTSVWREAPRRSSVAGSLRATSK